MRRRRRWGASRSGSGPALCSTRCGATGACGPRTQLWPQAEALKAEACRADRSTDGLLRAYANLGRFLLPEPKGLWREQIGPGREGSNSVARASSLYHLTGAITEASRRLSGGHAPTAAPDRAPPDGGEEIVGPRAMTGPQSPERVCRYSRKVGYQRLHPSDRPQRQQVSCRFRSQTGFPSAAARCATAVSTLITRSRPVTRAAVSARSERSGVGS